MKTSSTICQRKSNLLTYWLLERLTKNTFFFNILGIFSLNIHVLLFISDNSTVEHAHEYVHIHAYIFMHISGSIEPITLIWVSLSERYFPPAELEYRWCRFWLKVMMSKGTKVNACHGRLRLARESKKLVTNSMAVSKLAGMLKVQ